MCWVRKMQASRNVEGYHELVAGAAETIKTHNVFLAKCIKISNLQVMVNHHFNRQFTTVLKFPEF